MTEQQYREYKEISEEINPIKSFLKWCGDKYKAHCVGKIGQELLLKRHLYLFGERVMERLKIRNFCYHQNYKAK